MEASDWRDDEPTLSSAGRCYCYLYSLVLHWKYFMDSKLAGTSMNETRRLMLRLAHAHGTLFAIINIAFALSIEHFGQWSTRRVDLASRALRMASVLLPGGFFVGGLHIYDGDPGLGIVLAPFGALAMVVALVVTVQGARAR